MPNQEPRKNKQFRTSVDRMYDALAEDAERQAPDKISAKPESGRKSVEDQLARMWEILGSMKPELVGTDIPTAGLPPVDGDRPWEQAAEPRASGSAFPVQVYAAAGVPAAGEPFPDGTYTRWTYTVKNLAGATLATVMEPIEAESLEGGASVHVVGAADGTYGLGAYNAAGVFVLLDCFGEWWRLA